MLRWLNRTDNDEMQTIVVPQMKIAWKSVRTKTPGGTKPEQWTYELPKKVLENWPAMQRACPTYLARLENHPFRTLVYGDPRLDNWFFFTDDCDEMACGLIDWQLFQVGLAPQDLSWFF